MASSALSKITLALSVLSLFFLAFYGSSRALNFDEVYSVAAATRSINEILEYSVNDIHPPLYYFLLAGWIRLFGQSEMAVRSLSGVLYLFSVGGVYALARLFFNNRTALVCAVIYMTSPLAIRQAQLGRMYMLVSLLSVLSTLFYFRLFLKRSTAKRDFILYVLVNILGSFTHVWFFFVLFGQIIYYLVIASRATFIRFAASIALSLAPYTVIWLPILLRQITTAKLGLAWIGTPGITDLAEVMALFGGAFWIVCGVFIILHIPKAKYYAAWMRDSSSSSSSSRQSITRFFRNEPAVGFLVLLSVTLLTPFFISLVRNPIFHSRYTIVAAHCFALLAGSLLARFANRTFLMVACCFMLTLSVLGVAYFGSKPESCTDRSTASYLAQHATDNDIILHVGLSRLPVDYYLRSLNKNFTAVSFPPNDDWQRQGFLDPKTFALDWEACKLTDEIDAQLKSNPQSSVWVLSHFDPVLNEPLKRFLDARLRFRREIDLQCGGRKIGFAFYDKILVYGSTEQP